MIRVLFYTGIAMLTVSAALLYLPVCFFFVITGLVALSLIICFIFKKYITFNGIKTLLSILLIFCLFLIYIMSSKVIPAENLSGYNARIIGSVCEDPEYNDTYTAYILKAEKIAVPSKENPGKKVIKNIPQNIKIRITDVNNFDFKIYDKIDVNITFDSLGDFKVSSYGNNIFASGYIKTFNKRLGVSRPFYAIFHDFRQKVNGIIYKNFKYDDATVISAVLLGDRSYLSDEFYTNAKLAGVSHILVVSGFHLGVLFQILSIVLKKLRFSHKGGAVILAVGVFCVMAICGFTPSIMRAGITYLIIAVGKFFFEKPEPLNSLGIASVGIMFFSPFSAGNISFLLSFFSTFGLLFLGPKIYAVICKIFYRKIEPNKFLNAIFLTISQTLSATLATLPIAALSFGYISTVGIFTNLLIGFAMSMALFLALFSVLLFALPGVFGTLGIIPGFVLSIIIRYVVFVINFFGSNKFSVTALNKLMLIPFLLIIATIIFPFAYKGKKTFSAEKIHGIKAKVCSALLVIALILNSVILLLIPKTSFCVANVGKGISVVVKSGGKFAVIGAGDSLNDADTVENALLKFGNHYPDYIVLPALNKTFSKGVPGLIKKFPDTKVILPEFGDYSSKLNYIKDINFKYIKSNLNINLSNSVKISVFSGKGAVVETKKMSVIICASSKNSDYLSKWAKCDNRILIIPDIDSKTDYSKYNSVYFCGETDKKIPENITVCDGKNIIFN